jgi:hypothetical protein
MWPPPAAQVHNHELELAGWFAVVAKLRFDRPVPADGPFISSDLRTLRVLDARPTRYVDASTSEQSGARQSLAGIVVGEKNRCLLAAARRHVRRSFNSVLRAGRDNLRDKNGDKPVPRKSKRVVYLGFSPR